jgi:streptogramin lyase
MAASAVSQFPINASIGIGSGGFAVGGGAVWVGGDDAVLRIDPATGAVVATIDIGAGAAELSYGDGALWVLTHGEVGSTNQVVRIDPRDDEVTLRMDLPDARVPRFSSGEARAHIAAGARSAWVVYPAPGGSAVARIDGVTGQLLDTVALPDLIGVASADDRGAWFAEFYGGAVWHLDPATDSVTKVATVDRSALFLPGFAADANVAWFVHFGNTANVGTLARIDGGGAITNTGVAALTVAASRGQVWFLGFTDSRGFLDPPVIGELDPRSGAIRRVVRLSPDPSKGGLLALAVGDGAVWLFSSSLLTRIATT